MESKSNIQPLARLLPKDFSEVIEESVCFIRAEGFSSSYFWDYRSPVRHFLYWLLQTGCAVESIDLTVIERFLQHDCDCRDENSNLLTYPRWRSPAVHIIRFVRFLEQSGRIRCSGDLEHGTDLTDQFVRQLCDEGYAPSTARHYRTVCMNLIIWLHFSRIRISALTPQVIERFHQRKSTFSIPGRFGRNSMRTGSSSSHDHWVIERFVRHLAQAGHIEPFGHRSPAPPPEILHRFSDWLRRHRGGQESTRQKHVRTIEALLPILGEDPARYDAALIRSALFKQVGARRPHEHVRRQVISVRMYLRFLLSEGAIAAALLGCLPSFPKGSLCSLPQHIGQDDVERAIQTCDDSPTGLRDRAILLLLARLALRAQDILNLRINDIDWDRARVAVSGKSRQAAELPLPQDTGDALHAYISRARPPVDEDRVFICAHAPWRPLGKSNTVSNIARKALDRAGIVTHATRGAHVFRHSQATNLLREGASLDTIQTLLRHSHADSTAIYAKTDVAMLAEIAQPWIGGQVQ